MRILIVEDEVKTLKYLIKGLSENGIIVDGSHDAEEGLALAQSQKYDLIILDVMLPKQDGFSILNQLRKKDTFIPILLLTARDSVEDKVKGLELGADDYLVKPFAFSELLARIHSILRRGQARPIEKIQIADLVIDALGHRVLRSGQRIDLTQKEFLLLTFLARHTGKIMTRTLIAEQVWDINFESDTNVVDVAIRRLRSKVDDPFEKQLIHTVRGIGYVLEEQ